MSLNFGQDHPRDHYNQLVEAIQRLRDAPQDVGIGQHAAICAWSLCEWVSKHEPVLSNYETEKAALRAVQSDAKEECAALVFLRVIGNAKKHKDINDKHIKISNSEIRGGFSRAFSRAFAQAGLYVEDNNGDKYLLDDLLEAAREFWDQKLSDLGQ